MLRSLCIFALAFLASVPSRADQGLVGTYKLVSNDLRIDGEPVRPMGKSQHGYLVITPKVLLVFFTATERTRGTSVDAKAALLDSLAAYGGPWRADGNKLMVDIDIAWNEVWKGTTQVRTFEQQGKRLAIITAPQPSSTQPGKTLTARAQWERID